MPTREIEPSEQAGLSGADRPEASSRDEAAIHALIRAAGLMRRLARARMARHGLTPAQWGVLRVLNRCEREGIEQPRLSELGRMLLVQPPSLSAMVARMERAGLVKRRTDRSDRRGFRIGLSAKGRDLVRRVLAGHASWQRAVMSGLKPAERDNLTATLRRLSAHLEVMHAGGGQSVSAGPADAESAGEDTA